MKKNIGQMKGRAKEAMGDLTDNDQLKNEGRDDRLAGEAKAKVRGASKKLEGLIDRARAAKRKP